MKRLILLAVCCAVALRADETGGGKDLTLTWINFAILAGAIVYFARKALPPFFKSRSAEIQKGIEEARRIKLEADQRAREMEAKMAALGSEIEKFRAEARAEMEQEGARIRQETERNIQKLGQQAEVEIETAGKLARRELQAFAAKLSLELAEERVKERLNAATENGLIEGFVSDLMTERGASRN